MICLHCEEAIDIGEPYEPIIYGGSPPQIRFAHSACFARQIIGGLNHLRGLCTCCGGTEPPDPSDLTRRQAAIAAVRYWKETT
jgi:hypothetical protein